MIKHFVGVVPDPVYMTLVDEFAGAWSSICLDWFRGIEILSSSFMKWLQDQYFATHPNSGFYQAVKYPDLGLTPANWAIEMW